MCIPYDPAIPHLKIDPSKILTQVHETIYTNMFTKAWFIMKT